MVHFQPGDAHSSRTTVRVFISEAGARVLGWLFFTVAASEAIPAPTSDDVKRTVATDLKTDRPCLPQDYVNPRDSRRSSKTLSD